MQKKLFRFAALLVAVISILCLTACSEVEQAQKTMEDMFDVLKKGDYVGARDAYISRMAGDNDFLGCKDNFDEEHFPAYAMHDALFKSLEYKVVKQVSSDPATVTFLVEVEALDLSPVAEKLFTAAEGYNFMAENNEGQITEDEINTALTQQMVDISKDYIESADVKTKKTELEINVCYENGRVWRVFPDDKLVNVLTGGVYERYNEIMQEYTANDR